MRLHKGFAGLHRGVMLFAGLIALWWLATLTSVPAFLLPSPAAVGIALWQHAGYLGHHTLITLTEIVSGMALGVLLGSVLALGAVSLVIRFWLHA